MPCPYGINIPLNFEFLNDTRFASIAYVKKVYKQWLKEDQRANQCRQCGECEQKCPQQINIISQLKLVAKTIK
jgi:predicted aldo/keto reductase-like oxidoreductase